MTIQTDLRLLHHRTEIGAFLNARGLTGKGVEVGTLFGAFATDILKTWQGHLHCVDPWINQAEEVYSDGANRIHDMNEVFERVSEGIGRHPRCTLHRMMSLNGCGRFEDGELDFFYDDGNHGVDHVRADISAWWPKVKTGGMFSGHDFFTRYDHETNSDALTAVMELAEAIGIRPHVTWDSSWWFIKTSEADEKFREWNLSGKAPRPVYTDNSRLEAVPGGDFEFTEEPLNPVVVITVARFDWNLAVKLLTWWAAMLRGQPNKTPVIALCSPDLTEEQRDALGDSGLPNLSLVVAKNVKECGYFGGPNQMMKAALHFCENKLPDRAMIWMEADCVPTHANWVDSIMTEYRDCGRPFMGDVQRGGGIPHLTGVAVYHPNWRKLAPSLTALPGPIVEMGWDSQCAHDILPRSHIAKTIQQIWRPPLPITAEWAAKNIRPETALFHQCKDGSLIDVLCLQRGLPLIPLEKALCESTYETDKAKFSDIGLRGTTLVAPRPVKAGKARGGCEILIVSCKRDVELLDYCLRSIKKYATGFSGVTLAVPVADVRHFQKFQRDEVKITTFVEPDGKGMMMHEVVICRADEMCPHADHVLHVDSDCLFWRPVTPLDYIHGGRCLMVRERYDEIALRNPNRLIWRRCVEVATGITPDHENMVRHPSIFPRALYPRLRVIVENHTGKKFDNYVLSCENGFPQGFAEFPTLGAIAIQEMPDKFAFVDYDHARDGQECGIPAGTAYQYLYRPERDFLVEGWSHAGLARYRTDWDKFLSGELPKFYIK